MRVKRVEARKASHTEAPSAAVVIAVRAATVTAAAAKTRHRPLATRTTGTRSPNCGL